jgi:hypothetical protein
MSFASQGEHTPWVGRVQCLGKGGGYGMRTGVRFVGA